jgi:hypothetical protein
LFWKQIHCFLCKKEGVGVSISLIHRGYRRNCTDLWEYTVYETAHDTILELVTLIVNRKNKILDKQNIRM